MANNTDSIIVPPRYHHFKRDGWNLLYDPNNVSWVRLNNDGIKILELIKKYKTVNKVSIHLANEINGETPESITKIVTDFVNNLVSIGFLHVHNYKKRRLNHFYQAAPDEIYLLMTYQCNLKCKYCYNMEDRTKFNSGMCENKVTELTFDEYQQIVEDAKQLGVKRFIFTGGEALLNPLSLELGKFIRKIGMDTELITNGLLIDESMAIEIGKSFNIITVSLDSLNKESHERMRGKNTFDKVLKSIKMLKAHHATIRVNSVITRVNVSEILKTWRGVFEELDCDFYTPALYTPDTNDEEINCQFLPEMNELLAEQVKIKNFFKEKPGIAVKPAQIRFSCGIANGEISISCDGFVYPCHTLHKPELKCGNLREKSLTQILNESPLIKKLREFDISDIRFCKGCDFKYLCGGGCLALNYNVYGDFYTKNSFYCDYLRQEQIERLWTSTMLNIKDAVGCCKQNKKVDEYYKRSA